MEPNYIRRFSVCESVMHSRTMGKYIVKSHHSIEKISYMPVIKKLKQVHENVKYSYSASKLYVRVSSRVHGFIG